MNSFINATEFINHLKEHNLVIVSKTELDRISVVKLQQKRSDLLKKKSLTLSELLKLELLPVTSKQALRKWIENEKIKPNEILHTSEGVIKVKVSFLERLGYV